MRQLDLSSIVSAEETAFGWRALNKTGELLEVRSHNGSIPTIPDDVPRSSLVSEYLEHSERALAIYHDWRSWDIEAALAEIEVAIRIAPTTFASYHHALMLISLGRWREGFAEWETRFEVFAGRIHLPVPSHIPYWQGEPLAGKRIVLVHEQGYGESIQQLRYVPMLKDMGTRVSLLMPEPLQRLAEQCAPLFDGEADYFCPMLSLMHRLREEPDVMPRGTYLRAEDYLIDRWHARIGPRNGKPRIGIAWTSGTKDDRFPRSAPLELFVQAFPDAELYAIQQRGDDDENAARLGVKTFAFSDFADVAALVLLMDEIVAIDTAAMHVAGAIGHPNVTVLLPTYAAWRWQVSSGIIPIYPQLRIIRQRFPGDWESAFAQLKAAPLS